VHLPLPPQIISLSDLVVSVNGEPSEDVSVEGSNLVWRGRLDENAPAEIDVTYSAVGKGIYTLNTPPGKIVDKFEATLTAHASDLRMMDLSLQPDKPRYEGGKTIYHWSYEKLMIGRPIALDILGIAPMDRLGELVWLGPVSVAVFGLLVALLTLAYRPDLLNVWMLLLIVGAFAAAYPLMYFGQEVADLPAAVVIACAAMMLVVAVRSITLMGWKLGLLGVTLIGALVLTLTMMAALLGHLQGLLLTILAVGALITMMVLLPRAQKAIAPNAPWVAVWLSPQTMVMPGWVMPCSGPMICTMPWRISSTSKIGTSNSAQLARSVSTWIRLSSSSIPRERSVVGTL